MRNRFWVGLSQSRYMWSGSVVGGSLLESGHHLRKLPWGLSTLVLLVSDCTFWVTLESPPPIGDCVFSAAFESPCFMRECAFWIIIPNFGDPLSLCWPCNNWISLGMLNLWFTMFLECWMILDKLSLWFSPE